MYVCGQEIESIRVRENGSGCVSEEERGEGEQETERDSVSTCLQKRTILQKKE